jgi:hypothetical protein
MKIAVFTIISKNYLHFARTLMGSIKKTQPTWDRRVLLTDETENLFDPQKESFKVTQISELSLPDFYHKFP